MTSALRHIVDDFRDKLSRLHSRTPTSRPETVPSFTKNDLRKSIDSALPPSGRSRNASWQRQRSGLRNETETDCRTQTPDLIKPHVVIAKMASLPPIPPTSTSSTRHKSMIPTRRGTSNVESGDTAASSLHVYEEIPTLSRPAGHRRHGSTSSASSVTCSPEVIGRIYYVSPMDGALCRLYPTAGGDELTERKHQILCPHVRLSTSGRPMDIAAIADLISGSGTSTYGARGRELRLCSACRRQLREILGENSRDLNTCDLSLLHVPCPYASDDDVIEESGKDDEAHVTSERDVSDATTRTETGAVTQRTDDNEQDNWRESRTDTKRTERLRPTLGTAVRSAFSKYAINRRNSLPVNNSPATSVEQRSCHRYGQSIENVFKSRFNHQPSSDNDVRTSGRRITASRDVRRRPIVEGHDDVIMNCFSSPNVAADINNDCGNTEVGYLCLYDCQCRRCRDKFGLHVIDNSGGVRNNNISNIQRICSSRHRTKSSNNCEDSMNNNLNNQDQFRAAHNNMVASESRDPVRRQHVDRRSLKQFTKSSSVDDPTSDVQVDGSERRSSRRHRQYRRQCDGDETTRRAKRPPIKSVYYSGLLASMIDLTGCDVIATVTGSADGREDDRLSCRATSGPRSWGLEILQRSRSSKKSDDDEEDRSSTAAAAKKNLQWHRRRTSWVRHRPTADTGAGCPSGATPVINAPLHRSVGDLQLTSLQ